MYIINRHCYHVYYQETLLPCILSTDIATMYIINRHCYHVYYQENGANFVAYFDIENDIENTNWQYLERSVRKYVGNAFTTLGYSCSALIRTCQIWFSCCRTIDSTCLTLPCIAFRFNVDQFSCCRTIDSTCLTLPFIAFRFNVDQFSCCRTIDSTCLTLPCIAFRFNVDQF